MNFLKGRGRRITAMVLSVVMILSLFTGYAGNENVSAAGSFPYQACIPAH